MAMLNQKTLLLASGRKLLLCGSCLSINSNLEIGEGFSSSVLSINGHAKTEGALVAVDNPYGLSAEEVQEILDYIIGQCVKLKDNIRKHGIESGDIFNGGKPVLKVIKHFED